MTENADGEAAAEKFDREVAAELDEVAGDLPTETRLAILTAAMGEFAKKGFEQATVPQIARLARVDVTQVTQLFPDKNQLFMAAAHLPLDPRELLGKFIVPAVENIGERIIRTFLAIWDSPIGRDTMMAMLRQASNSARAAELLHATLATQIFRPLVSAIGVGQADLRASLIASQLMGIAIMRYVLKLEPLASLPADELAKWVGPTIQRYCLGSIT